MKLRNLKNSITRAGENNLVLSIWDNETENFFVINDVPQITRKQWDKLYTTTFGEDPLHDNYAMDLLPYNLIGDFRHPRAPGDPPDPDQINDWPNKESTLAHIKPQVKYQPFTSIAWKDLAAKVFADYPRFEDDFDE